MLKLNNKIHFYDINSGTLFLSQSQESVSVPNLGANKFNSLIVVRDWAQQMGHIGGEDDVKQA